MIPDYPDYTSQFPDPFAVKYEEDEKDVKSEDNGSNNGFEY